MLARLAESAALERARAWGLAISLARHLSGGAPKILAASRLRREADELLLIIPAALATLADSTLNRRLDRVAVALSLARAQVVLEPKT